jgi:hypothetical protein
MIPITAGLTTESIGLIAWAPAQLCVLLGALDLALLALGHDLRVHSFYWRMARRGVNVATPKDLYTVRRWKQYACLLLFLYYYQAPAGGVQEILSGNPELLGSPMFFVCCMLALFLGILYLSGFWHFMLVEAETVHLFTLNPFRALCVPRKDVYTDSKDWGDLAVNTLYIGNRENRHTVFLEKLKDAGFENMKNTEFVQPDR